MAAQRPWGRAGQVRNEMAQGSIPRRVTLSRTDFDKFGFMVKCLGCHAIVAGTTGQGHSETRSDMQENIKLEAKYNNSKKRESEFLSNAFQAQDQRQREARMKPEGGAERHKAIQRLAARSRVTHA